MTLPYNQSPNAMQVFEKRYLDKEAKTPEMLFRRVSGGKDEYFQLMNRGLFLPNSPTLFNMGTKLGGTLSACFVFDIMDALLGDWPLGGCDMPFANSIAGTTFKAMAVAKAGGGVGYYLGNIRRRGADVKSTHRHACGPVEVLKWLNGINALITQGGKRALAQMAILDAHHDDIREFIHCKDKDPQSLASFNISVSWRNAMLGAIDWKNVETKLSQPDAYVILKDAEKLWIEQCQSAWRTGDPGMYFWSTTNQFNATPHLGDINATNPCGETPNLNNEPCNLGSLAIWRFMKKVGNKFVFMWDVFIDAVKTAIRFMDDILDWNVFPHPDISARARETRKLGLGVMGYADALAMMHIPYDSDEAVDWGSNLMKTLNGLALEESMKLADTKGVYPAWSTGSEETKKKFPAARNSTRSSIAPTGTIAILADASSSIEPHYALENTRKTGDGMILHEKIPVHEYLNGFVPKVADEVGLEWHVRHQAAFQQHTDLGVSKTINLPESATVLDVSRAYRLMWQSGCKGGTVFRNNCRSEQVLVSKKEQPKSFSVSMNTETTIKNVDQVMHVTVQPVIERQIAKPQRKKLPKERNGKTVKFKIGSTEGYLMMNVYEDGKLGEIFIELANDGSTLSGVVKSFAKTFSLALQNGTPLVDLIKLHKNSTFEPRGMTGDPEVPTCTSIPDYIAQKLDKRFVRPNSEAIQWQKTDEVFSADMKKVLREWPDVRTLKSEKDIMVANDTIHTGTGSFCPDCGSELMREGSCMKCIKGGCGYSKC